MPNVDNTNSRLKTARMAAGFKRASDFCKEFDIPIATYNMHETGKRNINPKVAQKYSELLGINVAWLLTGMGAPYCTNKDSNEDSSELSEQEYIELLHYSGNAKIDAANINLPELMDSVDPTLFSKIVIEIVSLFKEKKVKLDPILISKHATTIYKDITTAGSNQKDRLAMVNLATLLLDKQLSECS